MNEVSKRSIRAEAEQEVAEEAAKAAKKALVAKLKQRQAAQDVLRNINRELDDLEQSIADGSFTG